MQNFATNDLTRRPLASFGKPPIFGWKFVDATASGWLGRRNPDTGCTVFTVMIGSGTSPFPGINSARSKLVDALQPAVYVFAPSQQLALR